MSAADHIKRIREALETPGRVAGWYEASDADHIAQPDLPLIAACSPDAMRAILDELADMTAERDRLAAELAKTRAYYATSQSHAADLGEALRVAQEERDRLAAELEHALMLNAAANEVMADGAALAAELEQERAQRITLQRHAAYQAEALRLMTAERDDMRHAHDHLARARRADVAEAEGLCADLRKAWESLQPASAETVREQCRAADPAGEDLCHWSAAQGWRAAERHYGITRASEPQPPGA